jgi:hypothetical protein
LPFMADSLLSIQEFSQESSRGLVVNLVVYLRL